MSWDILASLISGSTNLEDKLDIQSFLVWKTSLMYYSVIDHRAVSLSKSIPIKTSIIHFNLNFNLSHIDIYLIPSTTYPRNYASHHAERWILHLPLMQRVWIILRHRSSILRPRFQPQCLQYEIPHVKMEPSATSLISRSKFMFDPLFSPSWLSSQSTLYCLFSFIDLNHWKAVKNLLVWRLTGWIVVWNNWEFTSGKLKKKALGRLLSGRCIRVSASTRSWTHYDPFWRYIYLWIRIWPGQGRILWNFEAEIHGKIWSRAFPNRER